MRKIVLATVFIIIFSITNNAKCATINSSCEINRMLYVVNFEWWKNFDDEHLSEYICRAINQNHSLKISSLKSKEANEAIKSQIATELPTLTLFGNYARIKTPKIDFNGVLFESAGTNAFSLPLLMSYEADIFLKNHDKTKSTKKKAIITEYEEKAAYISTISDLGTTYLNIVKLDKLIEVEKEILKIRKNIYELTKERNKEGLSSTLDVISMNKMYTTSIMDINNLEKNRSLLLHKLAVYIGESANSANSLKRTRYDNLTFKGYIPSSISSEVVIYRPDIIKAEAELQKAKIDIKIARKEFLPTVPIIGAVGYTALELSSLFNWESTLGLISAGFAQNIFSGGRKIANLRINKIRYERMFENYKQTDLVAIQEINDSLCLVKYDTKNEKENKKKYELEKKNFQLINYKHKEGITSYLETLKNKENLLRLEKEQINIKMQKLADYITLYKAVGGKL